MQLLLLKCDQLVIDCLIIAALQYNTFTVFCLFMAQSVDGAGESELQTEVPNTMCVRERDKTERHILF